MTLITLSQEQIAKIEDAFRFSALEDSQIEIFIENLPQALKDYRLDEPLACWILSPRTSIHLKRVGIVTYRELLQKTRRDLQRIDFPRRCVSEIEEELGRRGSTLKTGPE